MRTARPRLRRNALRSTVVLGALCAATPAFATATVSATYSFDANGNETLVSYASSVNPFIPPNVFTQTSYSKLNFNPATNLSNQISNDITEIIGTLNTGATLYDLSFQAPYNSPLVQAGIQSAMSAISAASGPGVTFSNPILLSNKVATSSTSSSTYTVGAIDTTSVVTSTVGPASINGLPALASQQYHDLASDTVYTTTVLHPELAPALPNVYTVCTPRLSTFDNSMVTPVAIGTVLAAAPNCAPNNGGTYSVLPFQTDINVAYTTTFTIDTTTTTTNTTTTSAIYDINGVTSGNASTNPPPNDPGTPVPEPNTLALLTMALGAVSWRRRYRCWNNTPAYGAERVQDQEE